MQGSIKQRGRMAVMDGTGHTTVEYDTATGEGVDEAKKLFEQLEGQGFVGLETAGPGEGTRITKGGFDPSEHERVVMVPPLAGG